MGPIQCKGAGVTFTYGCLNVLKFIFSEEGVVEGTILWNSFYASSEMPPPNNIHLYIIYTFGYCELFSCFLKKTLGSNIIFDMVNLAK